MIILISTNSVAVILCTFRDQEPILTGKRDALIMLLADLKEISLWDWY